MFLTLATMGLAVALVSLPGAAYALEEKPVDNPPPVAENCRNHWEKSSASQTCSNEKIVKVMNYRCRITATCRVGGGTRRSWKVMDPEDAARLLNCSGWLKVGSC